MAITKTRKLITIDPEKVSWVKANGHKLSSLLNKLLDKFIEKEERKK